jgi:hypothetical protein
MEKENILRSDFILASAAQFTISFVVFILVPTIPIYLASFKAKEAEIGFLVGSLSVSSLVLRPFVGRALYVIMFFCLALTGVINFLYFYRFTRELGGNRNANL